MAQALNHRQQNAIQYVAQGLSFTEAGRKAGYAPSCAPQMVSKLLKRADAQKYLGSLRKQSDTAAMMTVTKRKEHLSKLATSPLCTPTEQMAAIHLLNKMDNVYVTKIEADLQATGGIMLVPMAGDMDDWQNVASGCQQALMDDAIEVTEADE